MEERTGSNIQISNKITGSTVDGTEENEKPSEMMNAVEI